MRTFAITLTLLCCYVSYSTAQNDYLVTTSPTQETSISEEELFIKNNFSLQLLCKWTPGIKFMFAPSSRDMFFPILSNYENEKETDNSSLKHKILTFTGTEEKAQELSSGTNYSTRLIFECEGNKYYHEIKNMRLDEICEKNPRACINGLVYLKDVDTAKELLIGKNVYILARNARMDDANNYVGYQEISIPANTEATITAIGIGSQRYPVKIVFTDSLGHSFYLEVAISRTNSGMDINDFQAEKKIKYFSNAISFSNKKFGNIESLSRKYEGLIVYPKKKLTARRISYSDDKQNESRVHLPRYTILTINKVQPKNSSTLVSLILIAKNGATYETEVNLKYDIIVKNDNYIEDVFGLEDIRKKYPDITEERWAIITQGELEKGMSIDECRLSLGKPTEIRIKKDSRLETWFYNGKTLDFENGTLQRFE